MVRLSTISDNREYSEMMKWLLEKQQHEVQAYVSPVDFERLFAFKPELLILTLGRKSSAFNRPIEDFSRDVIGAESLRLLELHPMIFYIPLIVVGIGLQEDEVETALRVRKFARFPEDLYQLIVDPQGLERYADEGRSRKISPYSCPNCLSQMLHVGARKSDLFCPRCFATVALLEDEPEQILYSADPARVSQRIPRTRLRIPETPPGTVTFSPDSPTEASRTGEPSEDRKGG